MRKIDEIQELKSLDEKEVAIFNAEAERQRKSTGLAYALLVFLGAIGVHQLYLGRRIRGLLYLILGIVGWTLGAAGLVAALGAEGDAQTESAVGVLMVGWAALAVLGFFLLWDLFTIPRQIGRREERVRREILARLKET